MKSALNLGVGLVVTLAACLPQACAASEAMVKELRLAVPDYREILTHIHRPGVLKPGEKRPCILIIGGPGCRMAETLATEQRLVSSHFTPTENIPPQFRAWEEGLGHAGQDAIALLLKHLLALSEVDRDNAGVVTFSFGVVGATGALARHCDLSVKFLIDWEGPSGPQNLPYVPPGHRVVQAHPASDEAFWKERTAAEFIKKVRCYYLRVQAERDHVQTLSQNRHAIEMLNNASRGPCPWTRCNDNPPNILYDEKSPEKERGQWFPGQPSRAEVDSLIVRYVGEMTKMPPARAKGEEHNPRFTIPDLQSVKPIYFTFGFHWDFPMRREREGPVRCSIHIRQMTDLLERHGIRAHYGFVGVVAQQLAEDFPETVAKIRKLKLAIGYHGGAGHNPRGPHRQQPDIRRLAPDDAIRALWTFETRGIYPDDHPQAGQPIPNVPGGWLAIQTALGVTPLQTDAAGRGALFEALGAGYPMSTDESSNALPLPGLHEIHFYGDSARFVVPPTYYGERPGELAPVTVDILEWFRILAENLPRDRAYATRSMSHANMEPAAAERLVGFMKRRGDFRITAPDPDGWQWKPENSSLAFYQKRYGVESLAEVMNLAAPLDELRPRFREEVTDLGWRGRPQPKGAIRHRKSAIRNPSAASRPSSLSQADILLAADAILSHWPPFSHDGDFGGPPAFVDLDEKRRINLADAFQAFVRAIDEWRKTSKLPESVSLKPLRGPIDFPAYELKAEQTLDHQKRLQGYEPRRIPRAAMPDPKVVASQGLPACGDFHVWIQTHTKADADDVIVAVKRVATTMSDHVPGVIPLNLLCHTRKGEPDAKCEIAVNPAEFLCALAQQYRALATQGQPNDVVLVSKKVTPEQVCKLLLPEGGNRFEGFIYRGYLTPEELDLAWTRTEPARRR